MHNKHALTNLKNRYRAVLKKCHLINTFGSLALVGFLCLSVNTAQAATSYNGGDVEVSNQNFTLDLTSNNFEIAQSIGEDATGSGTGGDAGSTTANNNTTNTSGTVTGINVYGGFTQSPGGSSDSGTGGNGGTATANNNTVNVYGTAGWQVYGGYAYSEGGFSTSGTGGTGGTPITNNNTVNVYGSVRQHVYGGSAYSYGGSTTSGTGGNGGTATANYNTVNVNGTAEDTVYGGRAYSSGGRSDSGTGGTGGTAIANNNTVNVNGTVENNVYGGFTQSIGGESDSGTGGNAGNATANYNTVNVNGTAEDTVYGGRAYSEGGNSNSGTRGNDGTAIANNNTVNVYGSVGQSVYGGYAQSNASTLGTATASYNTVHLNNATIGTAGTSSFVIGGVAAGDTSTSKAENNTVILANNLTFNGTNFSVGGGSNSVSLTSTNSNYFNGNTLIFNNYKGSSINTVVNFEKYGFVLDVDKNSHQAITIGTLDLSNGAGTNASVTDISTLSANNYAVGGIIPLINATSITGTLANNGHNITGYEGTFVENTWQVNQVSNDITATLKSKQAGARADHLVSAYGETVASMLSISNNTLLLGIESARDNVQLASVNAGLSAGSAMKENIFMPFASVYGGYSAVGDDNNIDINSISFVGGIGYTSYFSSSELLLAAFFETGHGGYNSYENNIHSEGDANYYGGGLFARLDMYTGAGNAYLEASAKVGSMHYDYYSDDIKNALGVATSYDVDSLYYGAHAGLGFIWNISDALALDMSAKYFYTHQEGYKEEISGSTFDVDALDSHRIKAGARLSYTMPTSYNFTFAPYMGLYYEHEFNDDVNATVDNFAVPSDSDSNGSTGILELGVKLASTMGLSANIGVEASIGARESVMGKLEFKYVF